MKQSIYRLMSLLGIYWGVLSISGTLYGAEGIQKWAFKTGGGVVSSPAIGADGSIYVGSNDGHLYAIGPQGDLKWKFMTEGAVQSHPALGDDGTIYTGSFDHNVYAVRPDGRLKWKFKIQGRVSSSPALGPDGTIYISSWDRYIYALRPDGSLKWKFPTRGEMISSPLLGPDGTIYVGSWDHHLYAIKDDSSGPWVSKKTLPKKKGRSHRTDSSQDPSLFIGGEFLNLKVDVGRIRQGPSFNAGVAFYRDPEKKVRIVLDFETGREFTTRQRFIPPENHYIIVVKPAKSD
jgi:outer membrane protein assembly factor BamB